MNLTSTKREELQRLRAQIDDLSMRYIRNLNDDITVLLFSDMDLVGLPPEFLKVGNSDTFFHSVTLLNLYHHFLPQCHSVLYYYIITAMLLSKVLRPTKFLPTSFGSM